MDALDVLPHMGLSLPAPQHQLVDLLGARSRSLQDSALSDAFYHLGGQRSKTESDERKNKADKTNVPARRAALKKPTQC